MNHPDRLGGPLPARAKDIPPPSLPAEFDEYGADPYAAPTSSNKITLRVVGRALKRHWWQALLLWIIGSVGLMALAYQRIKPTFDAFAAVSIHQGDVGVFSDKNRVVDFGEYKETQVKAITNPNVLSATLSADPTLLQLPKLRDAADPEAEIRSNIMAMVIPKTNWIQVSMSSESADEAARLVNAVVHQYLKQANDFNDEETERITKRLRESRDEYKKEVEIKRNALLKSMKQKEFADALASKERNSVEKERYATLLATLTGLELELVEAEARLAAIQSDPASAGNVNPDQQAQLTDQDLMDEFYAIPQVNEVRNKLNAVIKKMNDLRRITRNPNSDPTFQTAYKAYQEYQAQLSQMFKDLKPRLLQARNANPAPNNIAAELKAAEIQVQGYRGKIEQLNKMLETVQIKTRTDSQELLSLELQRDELKNAEDMLGTVQKQLSQAEFDAKNPLARVRLEYEARPSNRPNTNNRTKIMAVAPFGMLVLVMALCVIIELSSGRVVDPDDLPGRVNVPVIGVVPPLPQVQPAAGLFAGRDEFRTQRQLDQFVQSLDHLRVALTSSRGAYGRDRRCVLITSACSSEGKTTLAAQLAERCVNAGLLTLLIDADLRNPTLSRMLDVPTNRGLINILRGEALLDDTLTTIGGAGGFHFLPSGTPKVDPSRLLHGDRLAKLLAQARENFDIVIVDAPPVLPVPDALTIGKWTDGAILAVRYDTSRFPLVERANKRLASVGVSVIGAVVNGVRIVESTYGSYYPSYAYSNERAAQTPLDV